MLIGEVFTNVGCGPCVASDDTLKHILEDYPYRLSIIKIQYPSSADTFYQFNISLIPAGIPKGVYFGILSPMMGL
ncbi:hypothetical protein DRQ17_06720 [bacterium]|nr:MAG: hypothetical protein DRQ17_06720 [bacterium]RKZ24245.1 MAG: hypothetical protein DRQ23_00885 [bacterium]